MKKNWLKLGIITLSAVFLTACGNQPQDSADNETIIKIGASPTPHAEILEQVKAPLEAEGYTLEIVQFDDYILPNRALAENEIDANYFQHVPYFEKEVETKGYDFVNAGSIHLEKMGLYSNRLTDIKDLEDGATVLVSNSQTDWGRVITMLVEADLVTVKEGTNLTIATFDDIEENPKNLTFKTDIDPAIMTTTYQNDEADLIAINANYAEGIDLSPEKDAVLVESDSSPYGNMIAVRSGDENSPKIQALLEALGSEEVKTYVNDTWKGSITIVK